jgi:chemotaxis protein MotB
MSKNSALPWTLFTVTLVGLAAVIYLGHQLVTSETQDADKARQATSDLVARLRTVEAEALEATRKVAALEEEKTNLSTERDSLTQSLAEKDAELARLKSTQDDLQEKLKAEIAKGEVVLSSASGRLQVDLVDKVLFASGDAALSPRGEEVLARIGGVLAKTEDRVIHVSGHTDDSPIKPTLTSTYASNWELSSARAVNVVRFLAEKAHVPPKRLVAAGYGQYQPVATNSNPQGRARNRRIELLLMPVLDAKKVALPRDASQARAERR